MSLLIASNSFGIMVTTNGSATDLIGEIVGGPGLTTSNGTYNDGASGLGSGLFTGGIASGIGMESGIILTSGTAQNALGPNSSQGTTGPGTFATLAFDFTTSTGSLFFNYVFASEEYLEYVNSAFNDTFKLYVNGTNVAIVPGTVGTEVEIDTVNENVNSAFYNNNDGGAFDIEYDGFTDVFTAAVTGLDTSATHTMSFEIADVGDASLDSAVFIEAGSFGTVPTNGVPDTGSTLALLGLGLVGLSALRRKIS